MITWNIRMNDEGCDEVCQIRDHITLFWTSYHHARGNKTKKIDQDDPGRLLQDALVLDAGGGGDAL